MQHAQIKKCTSGALDRDKSCKRTEVTSLERKALSFASSVQRCFHPNFVKFNVVMFLKYGVASIPEKLVSVQTNDSRQTCGLLHWLSQVLPCTL